MPIGLKRFQKAESLHFITFSCFHRLPLLDAPAAKETVEAVLEQTRARHQARIYVLMPEHMHLLVNEPPQILLAQFLKALKQITSRKLRGQREKFWQDRYYDSNIHGETARSEVIRYIHRQVAMVPMNVPNHAEGAPGPSLLGTGD
jgi:putative transposase